MPARCIATYRDPCNASRCLPCDRKAQSKSHYCQMHDPRKAGRKRRSGWEWRRVVHAAKAMRRQANAAPTHPTGSFTCALCREKFHIRELTIDHIRPVSKGGSKGDWRNKQFACAPCNNRKSDSWDGVSGWPKEPRNDQ